MEYAIFIIMLALLQYTYFSFAVGSARGKYEVKAPKTAGDEIWERTFRVQQNTLEQLIAFMPGMLAFSVYVSSIWVLVPGIMFLVGRQLYSHLYIKDPKSRTPGFLLTFFANMILIFGTLIGIAMQKLA